MSYIEELSAYDPWSLWGAITVTKGVTFGKISQGISLQAQLPNVSISRSVHCVHTTDFKK